MHNLAEGLAFFLLIKNRLLPVDHVNLHQLVSKDPVPLEGPAPDKAHPEFAADMFRHWQGPEDLKIIRKEVFPQIEFTR